MHASNSLPSIRILIIIIIIYIHAGVEKRSKQTVDGGGKNGTEQSQ